jgi:hypothetical protein
MLVISHVTDLRASLPSNKIFRCFANNDIDYIPPFIIPNTVRYYAYGMISLWLQNTLRC